MSTELPSIEFYNGHKMPVIGLGSWSAPVEEVETALKIAIDVGYRHIDTAFTYRNEKGVGNSIQTKIQEGVMKREDIFVTSKLPGIGMRRTDVEKFLKLSLANLQLDYLDLYLVHTPVGMPAQENIDNVFPVENGKFILDNTTNLEEVWKGMEEMVDAGLTRSIGISNFNSQQIERILKVARIKPANIQVECHAYLQQKKLRDLCKSKGITVCAYGPIGSPGKPEVERKRGWPTSGNLPQLLQDDVVNNIAKKYSKSPAQILLRFLIQEGIVVIPKSGNPDRIKQNFQVFDFDLDSADLILLRDLDRGARYFDMPFFMEHPEYPFSASF